MPRSVLAAVLTLALLGCAQQRIRDESQGLLRSGNYEQAVRTYESGVKEYPESTLLRSGLIQAKIESIARLIAEAGTARATGRWDDAERSLRRALALDGGNTRVKALIAGLETDRRQRDALKDARALSEKDDVASALKRIAVALQANPRHEGLLALQRDLETRLRQADVQMNERGLAERRPISLDFRDAGLRTVLDAVSRNSGINFVLDKDIRPDIRVTVYLRESPVEDAIRLLTSTHQLSTKIIDERTILVYPNTQEKRREHEEQIVKVFYLASADAKSAALFLRSMLKIGEPFVDERTNMIAVRDSYENVRLAERLVNLYDTQEAEVLLELEVMEIKTSRLQELGVKFPEKFSLTPLPPAGSTGLTVGNARGIDSDRIGLNIGGVTVNLKREVGDFNILANPRIRARNKEKARILIGDKIPVITATTGVGGFVSDSVNYLDVGLKLDVEPIVYSDDEVAIKVALEVSSLGAQIRTASGSLAYQIGTRNATTSLRLRDGETQLLAGLISNEDRSNSSRVPGIGDLPVLGRLFSSQRDDNSRTELVLAITPRILRNVRRPSLAETELWVGTEAAPRLRPVGSAAKLARPAPGGPSAASTDVPAAEPSDEAKPKPGATEATLMTWSAPMQVHKGDVFVATLAIRSAGSQRGSSMQFSYVVDSVEVLGIEEGSFFQQGGANTSFTREIDAASGAFRAGVLRNQATGATGQGSLVTVRLRAKAAGTAEIALTGFDPVGLADTVPRPALPQVLKIEVKE